MLRINRVNAFVVRAELEGGYWGSRAWKGEDSPRLYSWDWTDGLTFPPSWRMRNSYAPTLDAVLVRIEDSEGRVGWGEAKAPVAAEATAAIVERLLADIVAGQSPLDRDRLWEQMYGSMSLRGHQMGFLLEAMSGVDLALWDLGGKLLGRPVFELLGGRFRERIPTYASGIPALASHEDGEAQRVADLARGFVRDGHRATKIGLRGDRDLDVATLEVLRDAVGKRLTIFVDAGGTYDLAGAKALLPHLVRHDVAIFEAPLPPEQVAGYRDLRRLSSVAIASDLIVQRYQALEYFRAEAIDVIQPDVCRSGGISECVRIAHLADAFGVAMAPHLSIGTPIQRAASAHLAVNLPNLRTCEQPQYQNALDAIAAAVDLTEQPGSFAPGSGPGLGVEVDEGQVRALAGMAASHAE